MLIMTDVPYHLKYIALVRSSKDKTDIEVQTEILTISTWYKVWCYVCLLKKPMCFH